MPTKPTPWFTKADLDGWFLGGPGDRQPIRPHKTAASKRKRKTQHLAHESRRVNFGRRKS